MGHYHRIVNLTQHAVIEPMDVGVLDKLLEFGQTSGCAMGALWLMLGREAWCGDRIAILGYEGRPSDLAPHVIAETGLDGTSYYNRTLDSAGQVARDVLADHGICSFTAETRQGVTLWRARKAAPVARGVDVVAANLDRGELIDPAEFGDDRDLDLAAARGGYGGVTTALAVVLAASNRGGSRGGGDLSSRHPIVGSWAGDHIGVLPPSMAEGFDDVSSQIREALVAAGEATYEVSGRSVKRLPPPWAARAS